MNRLQIKTRFRQENPEVTERVLTDTALDSWLLEGNKVFCCETRCISSETSITAVIGQSEYSLTDNISNFYDIDEFPGGGVAYDDDRLDQATKAQLDNETRYWRTRGNGTPRKYYRYNEYIVLDYPASSAKTIKVDAILLPDDFDNDDKTPFNQLGHLEVFHYAMVLYLQGRSKMKIGKDQDKQFAMMEFDNYVKWAKKTLQGNRIGKISLVKHPSYHQGLRRR